MRPLAPVTLALAAVLPALFCCKGAKKERPEPVATAAPETPATQPPPPADSGQAAIAAVPTATATGPRDIAPPPPRPTGDAGRSLVPTPTATNTVAEPAPTTTPTAAPTSNVPGSITVGDRVARPGSRTQTPDAGAAPPRRIHNPR